VHGQYGQRLLVDAQFFAVDHKNHWRLHAYVPVRNFLESTTHSFTSVARACERLLEADWVSGQHGQAVHWLPQLDPTWPSWLAETGCTSGSGTATQSPIFIP